MNKISVHRHDVSPIESDLLSCGRAIDSHGTHVTAAVACGASVHLFTVVGGRGVLGVCRRRSTQTRLSTYVTLWWR